MQTPKEIISTICGAVLSQESSEAEAEPRGLITQWRAAIANKTNDNNSNLFLKFSEYIYMTETNGVCEQHALKLAYLFKANLKSAANWLKFYADNLDDTVRHPLHDLCLHIEINNEPFPELWKFGEGNLKVFFTHMQDLNLLTKHHDILKTYFPENTWKMTPAKTLVKCIKDYLLKNELNMIGLKLDEMSIKDLSRLSEITKINERFNRSRYENAPEILTVLRTAKNSDEFLPNIIMRTEDIGLLAGYYMAKLPEDDVRGAMAGHFTGCCQRIGGQGSECAKHSIQSEYGCTYVLFKGKVTNNQTRIDRIHDTPIIVSWAWASLDPVLKNVNGICFDSIETSQQSTATFDSKAVNRIYTEFANRLLAKVPDTVMKICVGTGGETPENVGHKPIKAAHAIMLKPWISIETPYESYRDSFYAQTLLACREASVYYQIHEGNDKQHLLDLLDHTDMDILINLALNYDEEIKALGKSIPLPEWIYYLLREDLHNVIRSLSNEMSPNLSLYLPHKNCTALMYIAEKIRYDEAFEKIIPKITQQDLNLGTWHHSCLLAMARNTYISLNFLEKMLEIGGDPHKKDDNGITFVHEIMRRKDLDAITLDRWATQYHLNFDIFSEKHMSKFGHDLDGQSNDKTTPLLYVVTQAAQGACPLITVMLKHGATSWSPGIVAQKDIKTLLECSNDVDEAFYSIIIKKNYASPDLLLLYGAESRNQPMGGIKYLLSLGANPNYCDAEHRKTAGELLMYRNDLDLLLIKTWVEKFNFQPSNILVLAAFNDQFPLNALEYLLEKYNGASLKNEYEGSLERVLMGRQEITMTLFSRWIRKYDFDPTEMLFGASRNMQASLDLITYILKIGGNPNVVVSSSLTSMYRLLNRTDLTTEFISYLIRKHGLNPYDALRKLVQSLDISIEFIDSLLQESVDLNYLDDQYTSICHHIFTFRDIEKIPFEWVEKYGLNTNITSDVSCGKKTSLDYAIRRVLMNKNGIMKASQFDPLLEIYFHDALTAVIDIKSLNDFVFHYYVERNYYLSNSLAILSLPLLLIALPQCKKPLLKKIDVLLQANQIKMDEIVCEKTTFCNLFCTSFPDEVLSGVVNMYLPSYKHQSQPTKKRDFEEAFDALTMTEVRTGRELALTQ